MNRSTLDGLHMRNDETGEAGPVRLAGHTHGALVLDRIEGWTLVDSNGRPYECATTPSSYVLPIEAPPVRII